MNEDDDAKIENEESSFTRQVGAQAARNLKARRDGDRSIWFGLGLSGLVGWSVPVPPPPVPAVGQVGISPARAGPVHAVPAGLVWLGLGHAVGVHGGILARARLRA